MAAQPLPKFLKFHAAWGAPNFFEAPARRVSPQTTQSRRSLLLQNAGAYRPLAVRSPQSGMTGGRPYEVFLSYKRRKDVIGRQV